MRPPKKYIVVETRPDGGIEVYPMKAWCRDHFEEAPPMNPNETNSQQLRAGFKRLGWQIDETDAQVRLYRPGVSVDQALVDETLGNDDSASWGDGYLAETRETVFELEYQLRDFLAHNLDAIGVNGKRLRLYVDSTGRDGIEYPTSVGPIDILAIDSDGAFVVFELKRARVPDQAIGQIARYMGWLKKTIGRDRQVCGVIVAKTISDNLRFAVAAVPNVSLFEYKVSFALNGIPEAPDPSVDS